MFGFINWVCLICVSLLIGEIMVYFCKDAIKILNESKIKKTRSVGKTRVSGMASSYERKIAK